ncbi:MULTISPECIES: hypothetical protein [Niastella]|uniref:Uncharacterized protein n=1 Tax=Niastella soli TaxID=2821487 RepID=A0ABS3YV85_9BACT|nr:hypothetical protein [Niastella soli]MBO9201447.1 hypothetical protein [Niastella soli]
MVETGGSIFIALALVVILLALLPICLLYVRKVAASALLNVLKLLCFFVICQYLAFYFIQPGFAALHSGFKLTQFTLAYYLFNLLMAGTQGKNLLKMVLVSFLSITITIYALKGITAYNDVLTVLQAGILTVLAIVILLQLINNRHIVLASEPAFWIAGGLLCYNGMVVLMEAIAGSRSNLSQQIQQEIAFIITLADMLRMAFFIVAVCVAGKRNDNKNNIRDEQPLPPLFPTQGTRRTIKY